MKKITLMLSTIVLLLCFAFSVSAAGENAQKAVNIKLKQTYDIKFGNSVYSYYLKFTPEKTGFYQIELKNFVADNTYITTYDNAGESINFASWDEFSNRCYDITKLTGGKTYYYQISCYKPATITAIVTKHSHKYVESYVLKATYYYEGSITYSCASCNATKEKTIPQVTASSTKDKFTYNKKTQHPSIVVKDSAGKVFKQGADYTVTYPSSSINADTYYATVEMDNKYYSFSDYVYYTIQPKSIKNFEISISKTKVPYGEKPTVKISGLKTGRDFSCDPYYYGIGTYTLNIYGEGNYTGTVKKTFKVIPPDISGLKASKTSTSAIKISWKADKEYETDYYQIYDVSQKKIIKTIDNENTSYTIKKLKPGKKYSFKVRGYSKVDGEKYYGQWKTIEAATNPKGTTIKSAKSSKSKVLSLVWNKQSAATGYQIQYSTSNKFTTKTTKTLTVKKNTETSKTVSKLAGGKKYYVKIRTYKTFKLNNKSVKLYSAWSEVKSVNIKK